MVVPTSACRRFEANIFSKVRCQNCFKPRDGHSEEALELAKVSIFVAPSSGRGKGRGRECRSRICDYSKELKMFLCCCDALKNKICSCAFLKYSAYAMLIILCNIL